jgi:peroxiredoxin
MHSIDQEETQQPEDAGVRTCANIEATIPAPRNEAARLAISGPASGQYLRAFTLPDSAGRPVQLWHYLQRSNVVLFFHHGGDCTACGALLRDLAEQVDAYLQEETAVLAIGPNEPAENLQLADQLGHPFPLLSDPAGQVIAQQGFASPSLIIADR